MSRLVKIRPHFDSIGRNLESDDVMMKLARGCKRLLEVASWAVTLWWLALWLLYPTTPGSVFKSIVSIQVGHSGLFGTSGIEFNFHELI